MNTSDALQLLAQSKPVLAERFGVRDLALFGSTARGSADMASDIDVLVAFDGPATSARYFGVQFYLEDLLGRPVDLVNHTGGAKNQNVHGGSLSCRVNALQMGCSD